MAHFTRVRVDLAAWGIGTGVSQAEFEKFDANLFAAINGDAGGTWAPSAAITLGGEGMRFVGARLAVDADGSFEINCDALFTEASRFTGLTSFTSGIAVSGTGSATFGVPIVANAAATFSQNVTVGTSVMTSLTVNSLLYAANGGTIGSSSLSTLTVNSTETHTGPETHNGPVTINDSLAVNASMSLGEAPGTSGDAIYIEGDLLLNNGRVALTKTICPDADVSTGYSYRFIFNAVSATRNLSVTISNPREQTEFFVHNNGLSGAVNVSVNGSGVTTVAPGTVKLFYLYAGAWTWTIA